MNDPTIFDFIRDSNKQLSDIREDIGVLKTHAEQQAVLIDRVDSHQTRLGAVESDVRVWKRVFGGLFSMILVAGAATANWLKGN